MKRARKPPPPPSAKPWPCTILAVDTAETSGWAIWCEGGYIESGEWSIGARGAIERHVDILVRHSSECGWPAVLVLERPFGGTNSGTLMALGAAHHVWLTAWKRAGGNARCIVRVYPQTWRSKVLGMTRGNGLPLREKLVAAKLKQESRARGVGGDLPMDVGADEAAAICIGKWASHAGEVGAVLPAKIRKAALP